MNITDSLYWNFPLENITDFPGLLKVNPDLAGLNVTIPYKEQIIPFLDELETVAAKIGAVNTIKFLRRKKTRVLKGFNSDIFGFTESLKEFLTGKVDRALILGTGGASKAVTFSLDQMGIEYRFVSRKPGFIDYRDIDRGVMEQHRLIINTTPLGTFPDVGSYPPIPYEFLTPSHLLFDLVYNPAETVFLKKGKERGAAVTNGLRMLHLQAEKSWEIWNK